jgi:hypothetical protein
MGYRVIVSGYDRYDGEDIHIESPDATPYATFTRLAMEMSYLRALAQYHQERNLAARLGRNASQWGRR